MATRLADFVKLGDVLGDPPHYIVIAKLGFGDYSTVWLARDRVLRFVASA